MKRGPSGVYQSREVGGEVIRAFVPTPMPPQPPVDMSGERARLLERAHLACGRLDSISALLANPDLFLYMYVRREAVLSSQIEGTQSSLSDLLVSEVEGAPGAPFEDVVEVSNYVKALEHGVQRMKEGFPLSGRLIREIHGVLLGSGRGSNLDPGYFRTSQNWIGGTRPGNAHFVPAPHAEVPTAVGDLEKFMNLEGYEQGPLIRAALCHAQFETIHPFLDGNGRTGRLLIILLMIKDQLLENPLLYLSLYLKENREEYYRLLDATRTEGDWETWVEFFLHGVVTTADQAVVTTRRIREVFEVDIAKLQNLPRGGGIALQVLLSLQKKPVTSVQLITEGFNVSFPTANRAIQTLEKLEIIDEITGRRRDRIYAYKDYLAILSEGGEPIRR